MQLSSENDGELGKKDLEKLESEQAEIIERGDEQEAGAADDYATEFQILASSLAEIRKEVLILRESLEKRLGYDKTKEEAFDRLYKELDGFKRDQAFESIRPLFVDLILLFDRIENIVSSVQEDDAGGAFLESIKQELLEILYRRGVEFVQSNSSVFDPSIQKAIMIDKTLLEQQHNTVARVLRRGFRYHRRLIRPEEVVVNQYCAGIKGVSDVAETKAD